ncbi:hypothetical protein [Aquimarina atlantica]|uniref:hypothetical protein n=1 Tax=Aquimarina atlantica TaxID=1317122 RepID=UPI000A6785DC|nr:hypothetical protein [Aquimarina atlantica]
MLKKSIGENNDYMMIYGVQHISNGALIKTNKNEVITSVDTTYVPRDFFKN